MPVRCLLYQLTSPSFELFVQATLDDI